MAIWVDQESNYISHDMVLRPCQRGIMLKIPLPIRPRDYSSIATFNIKLSAGCLDTHMFMSLANLHESLEVESQRNNGDSLQSMNGCGARTGSLISAFDESRGYVGYECRGQSLLLHSIEIAGTYLQDERKTCTQEFEA
jgi:hypothetical protein